MNKTDRLVVALLVAALIAWSFFGRRFLPEVAPVEQVPPPATDVVTTDEVVPSAPRTVVPPAAVSEVWHQPDGIEDLPAPVYMTLSNAVIRAVFTSHGGGISSVALAAYEAALDRRQDPLVLAFGDAPALRYRGLPGFPAVPVFSLRATEDGAGIRMTASSSVVRLTRTVALGMAMRCLSAMCWRISRMNRSPW
jgi:hypothetical protein